MVLDDLRRVLTECRRELDQLGLYAAAAHLDMALHQLDRDLAGRGERVSDHRRAYEWRPDPRPRSYAETGILVHERGELILQLDDGGRWRLDCDPDAERWLGRRVVVEGLRSGFDVLAVTRINAD